MVEVNKPSCPVAEMAAIEGVAALVSVSNHGCLEFKVNLLIPAAKSVFSLRI